MILSAELEGTTMELALDHRLDSISRAAAVEVGKTLEAAIAYMALKGATGPGEAGTHNRQGLGSMEVISDPSDAEASGASADSRKPAAASLRGDFFMHLVGVDASAADRFWREQLAGSEAAQFP